MNFWCYTLRFSFLGVIALIVLAEEELVAIDLASEDWKMLGLPYLVSLHASAVTCSTYISDVPEEFWNNIVTVGKAQSKGLYSDAVRLIIVYFYYLCF